MQEQSKHILFGVLNWGLGHATRSIPIIEELQHRGHQICVASDGDALKLLKKSLHKVEFIELNAFEIRYSAKRKNFRRKIISQLKHLQKKAVSDLQLIDALVEEKNFDLIISDNAFGVYSKKIKSIYITHQLNVLSGWTTFFTRFLHRQSMRNYDEIWVPDFELKPNLSGKIGHLKSKNGLAIKYIGPISRFKIEELKNKYQFAFVLSGPEPQRTFLENQILHLAPQLQQNSILVRGSFQPLDQASFLINSRLEIRDYCTSTALQTILNSSKIVICRSGYTSLMDLLKLKKTAIYIPTPGQFEQEYLGKQISKMGWGKVVNQTNFNYKTLQLVTPSKKDFPDYTEQMLLHAFQYNSI